jgi:hypothetical protein
MEEAFIVRLTLTPPVVNLGGEIWHHRHEVVAGRGTILFEQKESRRTLVFWEGPEDHLWPAHLYGVEVDPETPQFDLAVRLCREHLASARGLDELPEEFT